jgi:hypothetical protein
MKPVTNLLTVTHTRNEARRKLVKSRDETCHKLRSITILNHRCLWTVTNLQWNLLQNRDETCYRLVNCYKLVIKLVTNLLRVTKLWWRFRQWLQSCQWKLSQTFVFGQRGLSSKAFSIGAECGDGGQHCMFFVWFPNDAAWNQPLDAHNCNEKEVYPMFRPSGLFSFLPNWRMINLWQTRGATTWRPLYKQSTTVHGFLTSSMNGSKDRFCASSFRRFRPHLTNGQNSAQILMPLYPPVVTVLHIFRLTLVQSLISHSLMPQVRSPFSDVVDPRVASRIRFDRRQPSHPSKRPTWEARIPENQQVAAQIPL